MFVTQRREIRSNLDCMGLKYLCSTADCGVFLAPFNIIKVKIYNEKSRLSTVPIPCLVGKLMKITSG